MSKYAIPLWIVTFPAFIILAMNLSAWWLVGLPAAIYAGLLIDGWREMKRREAAHESS